jgi:uncharacterized membrane protein YraQ (UPF0718 family)
MNFGRLRRLIVAVDAGEIFEFPPARLGVESFNVAALALTFLLFDLSTAIGRTLMAVFAVFLATAVLGRLFGAQARPEALPVAPSTWVAPIGLADAARRFVREVLWVTARTLPLIVVGVLLSSVLLGAIGPQALSSAGGRVATIAIVALVAVPLALPTFFESPLAIALVGAGAPAGAAAALLFAGPAINLPSLFTVARATSWRAAAGVAFAMWLVAFGGGLLVG